MSPNEMMKQPPSVRALREGRRPSEVLRRGYLEDEVRHLYALARFWLEAGDLRGAEIVGEGLTQVAPNFGPGWLLLAYTRLAAGDIEKGHEYSRRAIAVAPDGMEAMLYLVCCLLSVGDYNSAGTYLGEVGERIEAGAAESPALIRFFRAQLARFQTR